MISEVNVGLNTLLRGDLSEPEFYGGLVYKFKKLKEEMIFFFFSVQKNHYTVQTYRL